jgi:hypothetical protein
LHEINDTSRETGNFLLGFLPYKGGREEGERRERGGREEGEEREMRGRGEGEESGEI